jgi:hypothetical protein
MASPQQMVDLARYLQVGGGSPTDDESSRRPTLSGAPRRSPAGAITSAGWTPGCQRACGWVRRAPDPSMSPGTNSAIRRRGSPSRPAFRRSRRSELARSRRTWPSAHTRLG